MAVTWEKAQHTSFLLWDLDREFQNSYDAYEQWQARNRCKRSIWMCLGMRNHDGALGKALSLGRQVQRLMETGKQQFGTRFEQGDSKSEDTSLYEAFSLTTSSNMPHHPVCTASTTTVRNQATPV